ncbi:MAG: ATP-binding cassette domain-containing protein [Clostridiales bacterium]|nr:ATP-binding cassette domain-containing protein [Clostridiales bacterium]
MQIEVKNVNFAYTSKHPVLQGVNFLAKTGERVALTGPSGSGKSTLAGIIAGNIAPGSGEVLFDGEALPKRGFCPVQLIYQHPEKAINPRRKLGRTLTEAWEPDEGILNALGIERAWLGRYPAELSGGEMQRFCIARTLSPRTKFIVADEITTMLDVITQAQVWALLLSVLESRGIGLIAITHSAELAKRVCSRTVSLGEINKV